MLESKSRQVQEYVGSLRFDRRLFRQDIAGSIAHARMLGRQGIIPAGDADAIVAGLIAIGDEIAAGSFVFKPEDEDIHMAIEGRLFELVPDVAGRLHTGRSRNDQVALDIRLYLKQEILAIRGELNSLRASIVGLAERNADVVIAGYTHLQQAQPVLFAHHMLAYFEMFGRDMGRLNDCMVRVDVMPLGSGALAGVTYPIDRESVAKELGFSALSANSMDAVSDRDFVAEFNAAAAILMTHVSRLAEELVLWSSAEFAFITIGEGFTTGSSIMPQKRNPDLAELARGKVGRVYGDLLAILTTMKGLPLSYNRDLQEDKVHLFDAIDTVRQTLPICAAMLDSVTVHGERTKSAIKDYVLATDIADYLVFKGMPFRSAHGVSARISADAAVQQRRLADFPVAELRKYSELFDDDVKNVTLESSLEARDVHGGTAPVRVAAALKAARRQLEGGS
jgi:argininosuccinate lyase